MSVDDVHAMLETVRARRATVQAGISQEKERLEQERRALATEQARLWHEENCLAEYHVQRSNVHGKWVEVQRGFRPKPYIPPSHGRAKRTRQPQSETIITSPPRIRYGIADHLMAILIVGVLIIMGLGFLEVIVAVPR